MRPFQLILIKKIKDKIFCLVLVTTSLVPQVLASKSPALLDFHEDLRSLEAASKVNMLSLSHSLTLVM